MSKIEIEEILKDAINRIEYQIQDAPPSNFEEDNYDAGYLRGLWDAQECLRELMTPVGDSSVSD